MKIQVKSQEESQKKLQKKLQRVNPANISIILNKPRYSENIGAAARAMCNMGFSDLIVVDPENFNKTNAFKLATHVAASIVENISVYRNLQDALAPFNYIIGTTARLGGQRRLIQRPSQMAAKLVEISKKNRIALVFGPEDRGLTNQDLQLCHHLINIPTAEFTSLNLAQAVMIVCYEIYNTGGNSQKHRPRLATRHELEGMYDQLKEILVRINYINPENPDYWMNKLRLFFNRLPLRAREISIIRGICRQINWYGRSCFQKGVQSKSDPIEP